MAKLDHPTIDHKWRIGDKLRYVSVRFPGFIPGNVYTVAGYWQGSISIGYTFEGFGETTWKKQSRFQLVERAKPIKKIKTHATHL